MSKEPILSVHDLTIFLERQACMPVNEIVKKVSFNVFPGKVLGVLGSSGTGKTMTCHAIMNLLKKPIFATGSIQYKGTEILNLPDKEMRKIRGSEMALVMQNPHSSLNPVITIGSHMVETLRAHQSISRKEAKKLSLHYLEKVGFEHADDIFKQYPFQLSGGMLQRVLIAIALMLQPSIMITDEPTSALDKVTQTHILNLLEKFKHEYDMSILLVSHDFDVISRLADEVIVVHDGMVVEKGPLLKVLNQPQHAFTRSLIEASSRLKRGVK
ncbi:ABC transporter ATP-binding protein [Robertmurraya massiliosenegalensis]|uniref:ABC transporter ATP-binding protein n=1 Tax=Robertmurraya TaxID=2837507 RepID=UPI0039A41F11